MHSYRLEAALSGKQILRFILFLDFCRLLPYKSDFTVHTRFFPNKVYGYIKIQL